MSAEGGGPGPLTAWAGVARRRWRTGVGAFLVVTGLGAALLLLTRPIYRTEASIRLGDPPPPGGVSPSGGLLSFFQMGGDPFANDLELLGSRTVAERVVDRLGLAASLDAPRGWHRDSLFLALEASGPTYEASYDLAWEPEGLVVSSGDSVVARGVPGQALVFGGVTAVARPWREGMPRTVGLATISRGEAARRFRSSLEVERPRREANVVTLVFDHTDPALSEAAVRAALDEFVLLRTRIQRRESGETSDSLRVVAARTDDELRAAEDALERLQREERIVAPDAQSEVLVERQAELLGRLQRSRGELEAVDRMLQRLDAVEDPSRSWTALLSHPAFLSNQTLGELLTRLTDLHAQRETVASRRTEDNRDLRLLDEQIAYLDRSLRRVGREYRSGLVEQIATLEPEIEALDRTLARLPAQGVELMRRQRDVRLLGEVLLLTEQRLRQEELREALTYSNVQIIDPPALRDRPVWPRKTLGLAVVLLLAGGTGLLAMTVRERTDRRVRRGTEVRDILGAPVLAVVRHRDEIPAAVARARSPVSPDGRPEPPVVFAAAGDGMWRNGSARTGPDGNGNGSGDPGGGVVVRDVRDYAAAAGIAALDAPVAVVVEVGRTEVAELRRLRQLLADARGSLLGAVLVCRSPSEEASAWE